MSNHAINNFATMRRERRWAKERAADAEQQAHVDMTAAIAAYKGVSPDQIKHSNVVCFKAPADLGCTYVKSSNKFTNPCIFCGATEEDVF